MSRVVQGNPLNMAAKIEVIKTNEGRVLGVPPCDADSEMT
jgi:hypothetical protein